MTMIDPERLGPQDFDGCFAGEPHVPDAVADLARGRRRRRRTGVALSVGVTAVTAAAVLGLTLSGPSTQTAVPAAPSTQAASPSPSETLPAGPGPSAGPPNPPLDTAPGLRYSKTKGYLDRDGLRLGGHLPATPQPTAFAATTRNTYDLVRVQLDPERQHLGAYDRSAFTGGSGGSGGVEIGQKLSWTVKGQSGEGMLLVAVTRLPPGKQAVTSGDDRDGLCAGSFGDASCAPATVDGHRVFLDRQSGGGFVVDYVQPDGEIASALVDPLFGNNTDVPLSRMGITLSDVVALLTDPDLDVIG